jgi:hypothetical protein
LLRLSIEGVSRDNDIRLLNHYLYLELPS